jgi:hypothetical protein
MRVVVREGQGCKRQEGERTQRVVAATVVYLRQGDVRRVLLGFDHSRQLHSLSCLFVCLFDWHSEAKFSNGHLVPVRPKCTATSLISCETVDEGAMSKLCSLLCHLALNRIASDVGPCCAFNISKPAGPVVGFSHGYIRILS